MPLNSKKICSISVASISGTLCWVVFSMSRASNWLMLIDFTKDLIEDLSLFMLNNTTKRPSINTEILTFMKNHIHDIYLTLYDPNNHNLFFSIDDNWPAAHIQTLLPTRLWWRITKIPENNWKCDCLFTKANWQTSSNSLTRNIYFYHFSFGIVAITTILEFELNTTGLHASCFGSVVFLSHIF